MTLNIILPQVASIEVGGKLEVVIQYHPEISTLNLEVLRAVDIPYRPGEDKDLPCLFVEIYMLPKSW